MAWWKPEKRQQSGLTSRWMTSLHLDDWCSRLFIFLAYGRWLRSVWLDFAAFGSCGNNVQSWECIHLRQTVLFHCDQHLESRCHRSSSASTGISRYNLGKVVQRPSPTLNLESTPESCPPLRLHNSLIRCHTGWICGNPYLPGTWDEVDYRSSHALYLAVISSYMGSMRILEIGCQELRFDDCGNETAHKYTPFCMEDGFLEIHEDNADVLV